MPKPVLTASGVSCRSLSPFSRRPSPPSSATPIPTTSGLSFSKSIGDGLKKTNELLNQEVLKLQAQVESLRQRCELQEVELLKSTEKAQEAMALVTEESAKSKATREVIKSLSAQDRLDKSEIILSKSAVPSNVDLLKQLDSKAAKQGNKSETFSQVISPQTPFLQPKDIILSTIA